MMAHIVHNYEDFIATGVLLNNEFCDKKKNKREAESTTVVSRITALKASILTQGPSWNFCGICTMVGHG